MLTAEFSFRNLSWGKIMECVNKYKQRQVFTSNAPK